MVLENLFSPEHGVLPAEQVHQFKTQMDQNSENHFGDSKTLKVCLENLNPWFLNPRIIPTEESKSLKSNTFRSFLFAFVRFTLGTAEVLAVQWIHGSRLFSPQLVAEKKRRVS